MHNTSWECIAIAEGSVGIHAAEAAVVALFVKCMLEIEIWLQMHNTICEQNCTKCATAEP